MLANFYPNPELLPHNPLPSSPISTYHESRGNLQMSHHSANTNATCELDDLKSQLTSPTICQ